MKNIPGLNLKKSLTKFIPYLFSTFALFAMGTRSARAAFSMPCDGSVESPCGFPELMALIDEVIRFILQDLVLPIAVVIFIYGGFLYLTSGGNPGKRTKANKMFVKLLIGLFFCLAAWAIVQIILTTVGYDDTTFSPIIGN